MFFLAAIGDGRRGTFRGVENASWMKCVGVYTYGFGYVRGECEGGGLYHSNHVGGWIDRRMGRWHAMDDTVAAKTKRDWRERNSVQVDNSISME